MANKADAYVRNVLTDNINVLRKLPDGTIDLNVSVAPGIDEMINLPSPEVSLIVNAPIGMDIKYCRMNVISDVDLALACSRTDSNWAINIIPNDLPPDIPTTLNVEVGTTGQ